MAQQINIGSPWILHTWSLAVEEQFYLVLPFLIWFVSREKLPYLLGGLILVVPLLRMGLVNLHPNGDFAFYFLMPTRADALLLGVLCAWLIRNERFLNLPHKPTKAALYGVLAVLVIATALMALSQNQASIGTLVPPVYGYTLLALLYSCALLIAAMEKRGLVTFVTRNRLLGKMGVIAYGAYLLH
jgi:peptidoglycan/LPS O-acetylase OafA/YrhL